MSVLLAVTSLSLSQPTGYHFLLERACTVHVGIACAVFDRLWQQKLHMLLYLAVTNLLETYMNSWKSLSSLSCLFERYSIRRHPGWFVDDGEQHWQRRWLPLSPGSESMPWDYCWSYTRTRRLDTDHQYQKQFQTIFKVPRRALPHSSLNPGLLQAWPLYLYPSTPLSAWRRPAASYNAARVQSRHNLINSCSFTQSSLRPSQTNLLDHE